MKNLNEILLVAAFGVIASLGAQGSAQYQASDNDGVAASPKWRQQLNEKNQSRPLMTASAVDYRLAGEDGVAASPKLREQLDERKAVAAAPVTAIASTGYHATGAEGITASPKLREQLDERLAQPIAIAPLK